MPQGVSWPRGSGARFPPSRARAPEPRARQGCQAVRGSPFHRLARAPPRARTFRSSSVMPDHAVAAAEIQSGSHAAATPHRRRSADRLIADRRVRCAPMRRAARAMLGRAWVAARCSAWCDDQTRQAWRIARTLRRRHREYDRRRRRRRRVLRRPRHAHSREASRFRRMTMASDAVRPHTAPRIASRFVLLSFPCGGATEVLSPPPLRAPPSIDAKAVFGRPGARPRNAWRRRRLGRCAVGRSVQASGRPVAWRARAGPMRRCVGRSVQSERASCFPVVSASERSIRSLSVCGGRMWRIACVPPRNARITDVEAHGATWISSIAPPPAARRWRDWGRIRAARRGAMRSRPPEGRRSSA